MSFQQGVSGLTASARNLEVIGNNVANASTLPAGQFYYAEGQVVYRALPGEGDPSAPGGPVLVAERLPEAVQ